MWHKPPQNSHTHSLVFPWRSSASHCLVLSLRCSFSAHPLAMASWPPASMDLFSFLTRLCASLSLYSVHLSPSPLFVSSSSLLSAPCPSFSCDVCAVLDMEIDSTVCLIKNSGVLSLHPSAYSKSVLNSVLKPYLCPSLVRIRTAIHRHYRLQYVSDCFAVQF